jgi:signal transduction histidine kinase/DNA-binding response OmpR family regulator
MAVNMLELNPQQQIQTQLADSQNRADLAERFAKMLRQQMFTNRDIRPAELKQIAKSEVDCLLDFIQDADADRARQRGTELGRSGLGEQSMMGLGQVARQFCLSGSLPASLRTEALELVESYHQLVLSQFLQTRTAAMLKEQERMRVALEKSLSQYAVEMDLAGEVAKVAASTLNLDELLRTAVETIRNRFDLYYVGVFLADDYHEWAILRAGTGAVGQAMLQRGHKLKIGGESMIGWCIAHRQARVSQDVSLEAVRFENPMLPETQSELALPLIERSAVIGALMLQSKQPAAFSGQTLTVLHLVADQLANGVANAKLFSTAQANLLEAQTVQRNYVQAAWSEVDSAERTALLYEQSSDSFTLLDESSAVAGLPDQAGLAIPIVLRGQTIGKIDLFDQSGPRTWSQDEIALANTIAIQSALSLDNARLFQETQRRVGELTVLTRISRRLASTLDLDEVLSLIVEESINATEARQSSIALYNEAENALEVRMMRGYPPEVEQATLGALIRPDQGLQGRLLTTGRAVLVADVKADADYHPIYSVNTRSEFIVPIRQGELLLGALNLESPKPHAFADTDVRLIEALADQVAIAITNARAYEAERQAVERVREADRLKTEFLANMSHELRTPLNSIIGFSRVILRGIDGPISELQQTDLAVIYNSGQHLLSLINNILDISKIEAGKMDLLIEPVDLRDIAKSVMSTAIALVKDKLVRLEQDVPDDLPAVMADQTRVRQIMLNLVSNAAKFTETGAITLRVTPYPSEVHVSVSDTGIGVAEDKLQHIFEEFTQADASTTRRYGGTGLGLAITKKFVEMHKGRVWADSQVGVGSTFTFTLPREQPIEEPPPISLPTDLEARGEGKKLVLCIDDDPGVITLYKRYLEKQGYQVIGLTDSTKAVKEARRLLPFAITLDVLMPQRDGWDVLADLKKTPEIANTPIVLCSIIHDKTRGDTLGAADYLVKPITEGELLGALERVRHTTPVHKVLVVDDEPDAIYLLTRILENLPGYEVSRATSGAEALAAVQTSHPDLLILDLMMPDIDGFAVLDSLKSSVLTRHIPVIIVTAKDLTTDDQARLQGKTAALFNKGLFTAEQLLTDIVGALQAMNGADVTVLTA